jgi:phosphopantetheinyl transferase (holo-ACP synthase)
MLGFDLVDLEAAENQGKHVSARWMRLAFSNREQGQIALASDPHAHLWALWAFKEAAFKALRSAGRPAPIDFRRMEVSGAGGAWSMGIDGRPAGLRFALHRCPHGRWLAAICLLRPADAAGWEVWPAAGDRAACRDALRQRLPAGAVSDSRSYDGKWAGIAWIRPAF